MRNRCHPGRRFVRATEREPAEQGAQELKSARKGLFVFSENTGDESRFIGHRGLILRIGEKNALFSGKPHRQYADVSERADDSGNPGRMNQGKRQHLGKNGGVVWMAKVAERS